MPPSDKINEKSVRIPVLVANTLWHWGSLDISKKRAKGISFEGDLFSMSACPNAWLQICRYGAQPLFKTQAPLSLIDSHSIFLSRSHHAKGLQKMLIQWGLAKGLLEEKEIYQYHFEDEDGEAFMEFTDLDDAVHEAGDPEMIETITKVVASAQLKHLHGFNANDVVGHEYVLLEWAKTIPGVDGVYWDDVLKPFSLSAPRAGLFSVPPLVKSDPLRLPSDTEALSNLGKVEWKAISRHRDSYDHSGPGNY